MHIKDVKPSAKSGFHQGYYTPVNLNKYTGSGPIIYRSSWEKKFCQWCDFNDEVVKWSSEPFQVRYFNLLDQQYHTYYPDFYVKLVRGDKVEEYVVEVKPDAQLRKPTPPKRKTQKAMESYKWAYETFVRNYCKVEAVKEFARQRNYKVMLLTENSKLF